MGRGHLDAADLGATALHYRLCVLHSLSLQVTHDLEVGDRPRARLPGERLHVVEVVEVAVGNEHGIQLTHALQVFGGMRVIGQEGVYDDLLATSCDEPES